MVSDEIILKIFWLPFAFGTEEWIMTKGPTYTDHNFAHKSMTLLSILVLNTGLVALTRLSDEQKYICD